MKRPREPKQYNFWLNIIKTGQVQSFFDRAGHKARHDLQQAIKYKKWQDIQDRKEDKVYA